MAMKITLNEPSENAVKKRLANIVRQEILLNIHLLD